MLTRQELWFHIEDFQEIVDNNGGDGRPYREYTSTELDVFINKWINTKSDKKWGYSKTKDDLVQLLSEPVLDPRWAGKVQADLGEDTVIEVVERDHPFQLPNDRDKK